MKLYGSLTSPFVRKVRIVAAELGEPIDFVDAMVEPGLSALKAASPIWKIPVAELDGRTIYDSRAIVAWLTSTRGYGPLAPPRDPVVASNQQSAIDAILDSAIPVFYLKRDGVDVEPLAFAKRQLERVKSILDWIGAEAAGGRFGRELGVNEIALLCALDWLDLRAMYPTARHDATLGAFRRAQRSRPSFVSTAPPK